MKCDTCGKESDRLARVVIDEGYNRAMAKPLWNCPQCFEAKERARTGKDTQSSTPEAPSSESSR